MITVTSATQATATTPSRRSRHRPATIPLTQTSVASVRPNASPKVTGLRHDTVPRPTNDGLHPEVDHPGTNQACPLHGHLS